MKIERLLSIIILLLNKDRIPAKELAERFKVTIRTIYRDIETIHNAGIPVISYQGNNGGFGINENFKLDNQFLKMKDMHSILTGLREINKTLKDEEIENTIHKISSLLPSSQREKMDAYQEQLVIDFLPWGINPKNQDQLKLIQKSIKNCMILKIHYRNMKNELKIRNIEPMTLIFKGYYWYLFAFCLEQNDFRLFKLSRIKEIEQVFQTFKRRNKSYQDIFDQIQPPPNMITLKLQFSPSIRARVEEYMEEPDIQEDHNGFIIATITFPLNDWLYSFILGLGNNVKVLEPPHFRETIKKKIQDMNGIY